jgi:phenylalanine-4-hydroxylase
MNFDIKRVIESKKAMRKKLAHRSIEEKLEMLDVLRQRALDLQKSAKTLHADTVHEQQTACRSGKKQ